MTGKSVHGLYFFFLFWTRVVFGSQVEPIRFGSELVNLVSVGRQNIYSVMYDKRQSMNQNLQQTLRLFILTM